MTRQTICLFAAIVTRVAVAAGQYHLADTSAATSGGWANAAYWLDAGNNPSGGDGGPLDNTAEYVVSTVNGLRTPSGQSTDCVFGGKRLSLDGQGRLLVYTCNPARLVFPDEGLFLASSEASKFQAADNAVYTLVGNITVAVADYVFSSEKTAQTFVLDGTLFGESGSRLRFIKNASSVKLPGNLSGFAGTIALWVAGSRLEVARNVTPCGFYFNGAGTLAVSNMVTAGSLTMPANSTLEIGGWYRQDQATGRVVYWETGQIVITNSLSLASPINIKVKDSALIPNTMRIPVLTAPVASGIKADDFSLDATAFTGPTLSVETNANDNTQTLYLSYEQVIEPIVITNDVTIGSLDLLPGARLEFGGKGIKTGGVLTGWETGCLTITDSLTIGGQVEIVAREDALVPVFPGETPEMMSIALMIVPEATELDVASFSLSAEAFPSAGLSVRHDVGAGTKTLFLDYEPTVVMTISDSNSQNFGTGYGSSLLDSSHWSNAETLKEGFHYLIRTAETASPGADGTGEHTVFLRTPGGDSKGAYCETSFLGDTLIIGKGCCFTVMDSYVYFRNGRKLRLLDGAAIRNGQGMSTHIVGPVEMPSGEVSVGTWCDCLLFFEQPLSGAAKIRCRGAISSTSSPGGTTVFNGDLSRFSGKIDVDQFRKANYGLLYVVMNIGGYASSGLPVFDPASVSLNTQAKFVVSDNVVLAAGSNRGFKVGDDSGVTVDVSEGKTLDIGTQITMADNGLIFKTGSGKLKLGGDVRFGQDGVEQPVESKTYGLSVVAGTLAVSGTGACDGLSLSFAEGASLLLEYDPNDAELARYGIKNVKASTPFSLASGVTTLPLTVSFPVDMPRTRHDVALTTVSSSAAESVRAMLSGVVVHCRGFSCTSWEKVDADGNVTFGRTLLPRGMIIRFH